MRHHRLATPETGETSPREGSTMQTQLNKIFLALALIIAAKTASAISITDMPGYTNDISVLASSAALTGVYNFSAGSPSAVASLTDDLASSWAYSNSDSAYMDLSFGTAIYDQAGTDLSIFYVGAPPHSISLSLFNGSTSTKAKTFSAISYTGYCIDNDRNGVCSGTQDDPIYVMDIDFEIFHLFDPIESIRLDVSKGSAVPSLIGAYHTTVSAVPLPLPLFLFSSGLAMLGFITRTNKR
jgi:hypothetical protein